MGTKPPAAHDNRKRLHSSASRTPRAPRRGACLALPAFGHGLPSAREGSSCHPMTAATRGVENAQVEDFFGPQPSAADAGEKWPLLLTPCRGSHKVSTDESPSALKRAIGKDCVRHCATSAFGKASLGGGLNFAEHEFTCCLWAAEAQRPPVPLWFQGCASSLLTQTIMPGLDSANFSTC